MEIQSTQTSRSIAVLIIIVVLIVVSAIIPAKWLGKDTQVIQKPKLDLSAISSVQEVATDANNDGVITWKEVMSDTLHLSTTTLQEIKSIPVDQKEVDALNDPNNLTSSFAKNIYLASAYLDKNGITDQASKDEIVAKLIQDEKAKIVTTVYTLRDINVAKTESKESVKAYGNSLGLIMENIITEKSAGDDMSSIQKYVTSKNASDLQPLIITKKRVDSVLKKLLSLSVPPSATIFHIIALNKIRAFGDVVSGLSNADNDPMRATLILSSYTNTAIEALRVFNQFSSYFNTQNIVFSSKEKGYVFTVGYNTTN